MNVLVSERKPTADQQLTNEIDEVLATLDQLQTQLTSVQQEALPSDASQASDMLNKYEVLYLNIVRVYELMHVSLFACSSKFKDSDLLHNDVKSHIT